MPGASKKLPLPRVGLALDPTELIVIIQKFLSLEKACYYS